MNQVVTNAVLAKAPPVFVWGDNGEQLTPAQAAARAQIANSIIANGRAPRSVGEGLTAIGDAIVAKKMADTSSAAIQQGTQQATTDLQAVLTDPSKAATFLANDQYATEPQKAVAQAILSQQMMLTNPDMIAQRNLIASEIAKNNAMTGMYGQGGEAVGPPQVGSDGKLYVQTQYGGMRPTGPKGSSEATDTSSLPAPTQLVTTDPAPVPPAAVTAVPDPAAPPHILTPAELEQQKTISSGLGTDLLKTRDDAKAANDLQQYVQEGRALISLPSITGAGADFKIAATKWAASLGIPVPQDAANNSDAFKAVMGQAVGQIIKQFGSGTGLSDADREYAKNIAGGNIELNKAAILRILDIAERNAQSRIDQYNQQVKAFQTGDVNKMLTLPEPTGSLPQPPQGAPVGSPVTKSIGGVTYTQGPDGQWYY